MLYYQIGDIILRITLMFVMSIFMGIKALYLRDMIIIIIFFSYLLFSNLKLRDRMW